MAPYDQLRLFRSEKRSWPDVHNRLRDIALEPITVWPARENLIALLHVGVSVQQTKRDFLRHVSQGDYGIQDWVCSRDPEILIRQRPGNVRPGDFAGRRNNRAGADRRPHSAIGADLKGDRHRSPRPFHADSVYNRLAREINCVGQRGGYGCARYQLQCSVVHVQNINRAQRQGDDRLVLIQRQNQLLNAPTRRFYVRQLRKHETERLKRISLHFGADGLSGQAAPAKGVINNLQRVKCGAADAARKSHFFSPGQVSDGGWFSTPGETL